MAEERRNQTRENRVMAVELVMDDRIFHGDLVNMSPEGALVRIYKKPMEPGIFDNHGEIVCRFLADSERHGALRCSIVRVMENEDVTALALIFIG